VTYLYEIDFGDAHKHTVGYVKAPSLLIATTTILTEFTNRHPEREILRTTFEKRLEDEK